MTDEWDFKTDCHAWVERPDGSILDWWFNDYETIVKVQGLEKGISVYMPDDKYHRICMEQVHKKIRDCKASGMSFLKKNKDCIKFFLDQPASGNCFMNAYAYCYFNRDCKLRVGNFGWAKKKPTQNITTWFEFGDADMKLDWKHYYHLYPANERVEMEIVSDGPWNKPYILPAAVKAAAKGHGITDKQVDEMRNTLAEVIAEGGCEGLHIKKGMTMDEVKELFGMV